MKIAIVGGGLTGLTAGYYLSKNNHQVTVFEKNPYLGGLAASFKKEDWSWPVEFYVHHIFRSDKDILKLAGEIGVEEKIFFSRPKTSTFIKGKISQFDSPISILGSKQFNFPDKIRLVFWTGYLKLLDNWKDLEKVTAENWLKEKMGNKVFKLLWEPLLVNKFSKKFSSRISAAWFWARIKKRGFSLGYFKDGFKTLFDKLEEEIIGRQGKIILGAKITEIEKKAAKFSLKVNNKEILRDFDKVIYTGPAPIFSKIAKILPKNFTEKIASLESVGNLGLLLELKAGFFKDKTYWLNVNEASFPFVCVVEQTNFIDKKFYDGSHLLYVYGYYLHNHPFLKMSKEKILEIFLPYMEKINPDFSLQLIINYSLFKNLYSQPIIPTDYSRSLPPLETPVKGLYFATLHHLYPWDRGTNYAVKLGKEVAYESLKEK